MPGAAAEPVYLQLDPHPVFGLFHAPAEPGGDVAVVLCPPFGWEDMVSYRGRRAWAEHLARDGVPVLRLDLPGTGDSGGAPGDPDLVAAWIAAVGDAAAWLRQRTGCERVAAIGIGLGGLLAASAAADGAALDALVLWGVPARGRTLVRELHAFARMEASRMDSQGAPDRPLPEGAIAAAGYLLTDATRQALAAIDLSAPEPAAGVAPDVLLLERDGMGVDERLRDGLAGMGAHVAVAPGAGYGEMVMGDMQAFRMPVETFAAVSTWLRRPHATTPERDGARPVPSAPAMELRTAGGGVRESALVLDTPEGELFGILAEPIGPRADLCALLLNAGPQRRTGPNRMWVEIARRWAAHGVPTFRLDVAGIGDAPGAPRGWDDEPAFYDGRHLAQVRSALSELRARGLPEHALTLGLCSGANWAFHVAVEDPTVVCAVLLNPRALFWDRWTSAARGGRELIRLASPATWRRLLTGQVSRRAVLRVACAAARRIATWPRTLRRRLARGTGAQQQLDAAMTRLVGHDGRLVLVFTDQEPLRAELEASGALPALAARPEVEVQIIPSGAETHTLQPPWVQRKVHEAVDAVLERELRRLGSR
jgi:pimeloyl-ACP methyl ester carboxylesterase